MFVEILLVGVICAIAWVAYYHIKKSSRLGVKNKASKKVLKNVVKSKRNRRNSGSHIKWLRERYYRE